MFSTTADIRAALKLLAAEAVQRDDRQLAGTALALAADHRGYAELFGPEETLRAAIAEAASRGDTDALLQRIMRMVSPEDLGMQIDVMIFACLCGNAKSGMFVAIGHLSAGDDHLKAVLCAILGGSIRHVNNPLTRNQYYPRICEATVRGHLPALHRIYTEVWQNGAGPLDLTIIVCAAALTITFGV